MIWYVLKPFGYYLSCIYIYILFVSFCKSIYICLTFIEINSFHPISTKSGMLVDYDVGQVMAWLKTGSGVTEPENRTKNGNLNT